MESKILKLPRAKETDNFEIEYEMAAMYENLNAFFHNLTFIQKTLQGFNLHFASKYQVEERIPFL